MRFDDGHVAFWEQVIGPRLGLFPDRSWRELDGTPPRLIVPGPERQAIYVVVDPDDEVVYVGKCDRASGCVADRFRQHSNWSDYWDRVWVLPLNGDVQAAAVLELEDALIRHYRPVDNVRGLSRASR